MDSKTIVIEVPPGAGRVCVTVWPPDDTHPHGWEEVSVCEAGNSNWLPIELTAGGYEVQDHRGTVLRTSEAA